MVWRPGWAGQSLTINVSHRSGRTSFCAPARMTVGAEMTRIQQERTTAHARWWKKQQQRV